MSEPGRTDPAEPTAEAMTPAGRGRLFADWRFLAPLVAVAVMAATWGRDVPSLLLVVVAVVLGASVLAAVYHAEVVAHRVGEPFGSLLLAVAVTVIEVGLIVTLMVAGGSGAASLARDTVFAAVMITCNGILGLSLLIGASKFRLAVFNAEGTGAALSTVATLAVVCLVLPTFTTARSGPEFSPAQLTFAAAASLTLYAAFVSTQTVRHRDFFLPVTADGKVVNDADGDDHADPPTNSAAVTSVVLLLVALVAVVGLAKVLSPAIEATVADFGLPHGFVGVVIALLVLLPETLAASNAARRNRIQVSLNLALGSAMASIGLTIPAIALTSIWLPGPLQLGLGGNQIVLLAITIVVAILTVVPGRATRLQGLVHLILLGAFLLLAANP